MGQKQKENKKSGKALAQSSQEILDTSRPARDSFFKSLTSALKTGGAGGDIPQLNTALEAVDAGTAETTRQTKDMLGKIGAGSSGAGLTAGIKMEGDATKTSVRTGLVQQMLGQVPNAALTFAQTGQEGLAKSVARNTQISLANDQAKAQAIAGGTAAVGAIAGAAIIAV